MGKSKIVSMMDLKYVSLSL